MSEVYSVEVEITAPVNDTEVTDRVADAITNLFTGAAVEPAPGELRATTHTLDGFAEKLREQEILDTARKQFFERRRGDTFTFSLKKQAAFEGVVNFAVGDQAELGDIQVSVRVNEPDVATFVDAVAPPTEDGVPLDCEER
jgi:predicted RNA binding protein with dsRBD fold (UPF0201 family)